MLASNQPMQHEVDQVDALLWCASERADLYVTCGLSPVYIGTLQLQLINNR